MTKEEFRKHCEQQIDRCIQLNDYKHLREHELSLALLNECETRNEEKEQLKERLQQAEDVIDKIKRYIDNADCFDWECLAHEDLNNILNEYKKEV